MFEHLSDFESHPVTQELMLRSRAMEASCNGILIANAFLDGMPIIYANTAHERISGYKNEDVLGQSFVGLYESSPDVDQVTKIQATVNEGLECSLTIQNLRQDENPYWVELTISPIKSDEGEIQYYIAVEQDVTEREIAKQKLEETLRELQALNTRKDQFLGMAVHDLRGPINNVRIASNLLIEYEFSAVEQTEILSTIYQTSEKMLNLINDLLDINAIESGKLELKLIDVNIAEFIERISRMNNRLGEQKGIQLHVDLAQSPVNATFDPQRIEQVLDNLIGNAFKFSHRDTTVKLTVMQDDGQLKFSVQDEGQGIKAEELDQLFGSFQRTSTLPTANESSSGLGLSICKRIVEQHGGTIRVDSTYGEGSTFSFSFPMKHTL